MKKIMHQILEWIRSRARNKDAGIWPRAAFGVEYLLNRTQRHSYVTDALPDDKVSSAVSSLQLHGFYAIPEFVSQDICADLRTRIDKIVNGFPQFVHPAAPYDKRIHGIENIDEAFLFFTEHPLLKEIASRYLEESARSAFTLAARLDSVSGNPGSGGGWHRDSNYRQIKAMVYLSDVSEENGTFQLLYKSHKFFHAMRDNSIGRQKYGEVRWREKQVEKLLFNDGSGRLRSLTGKAGTVLLFDSSAIHRGAPNLNGMRYAMTNYFYPERLITLSLFAHFAPVASFEDIGKSSS